MPERIKRERSGDEVSTNSGKRRKKAEHAHSPAMTRSVVAPVPSPHKVVDNFQVTVSEKQGNAARECPVPTDILDDADSKVLSQRYCLLVQERYRAQKQAQELPYYLSTRKDILPLVLDESQNTPSHAENEQRDQERELREWINCGTFSAQLPNVVLRVAGLTSKDAEEAEEYEDEEERGEKHWDIVAEKEKRMVDDDDHHQKKKVEVVEEQEDSSGDEDYAKDYYASDAEEVENENA
jgi:hypothetical protein